MKIALATYNLEILAGGNRLVFAVAQSYKKLGHEVKIYAPLHDPDVFPELAKGLEVIVVPPKTPFLWSANPKGRMALLKRKWEQEKLHLSYAKELSEVIAPDTDVLQCHDFAYPAGYFLKSKNPRVKVAWIMNEPPHSYLPKKDPFLSALGWLYNRLKDVTAKKYLAAVDGTFVLNELNRKWAAARGLAAFIVRPGADYDKFHAPLREFETGRKKVTLLSVGAPHRHRRFEDTLGAARILAREGYEVETTIVGKNDWHEDEYCGYLMSLAEKWNLRVDFRFDGVSDEGLKDMYRTHDVFVLPIHVPPPRNGYGWQLTTFEAMAAGTPVILCRTNDCTEVLTDGVHALFADPMSPEDIARQAKRLFETPGLYAKLTREAQAFTRENLSWEAYARNILAALRLPAQAGV